MFFKSLFASSVLTLTATQALAAGVKFAGVNIAGFDFGCATDGTCSVDKVYGPVQSLDTKSTASGDGPGQMNHFVTKDKLNMFRLPVAWQYLVNGKLGATLDATAIGSYDKLMQGCLATGAYCIIDIHNYARWNGQTIGSSGGPTNDDFSGLWKQLATKYAAEEKVVMGLMNEPHDMPSLNSWAGSVQAAVKAIRGAGATSQMILLPGNGYTGASTFVSGGSAAALAGVTNPDGSTTNLIFDVHQYLDTDGSGTHATCVKDSSVFTGLLAWLQDSKRQALVSEIGGGSSNPSCITNVCEVLDFLNTYSDQFLGYIGWAAGSFDSTYVLSLGPDGDTDVPLMEKCFAAKFNGGADLSTPSNPISSAAGTLPSSSSSSSSSSPSSSPSPVQSASSSSSAAGGASSPNPTSSSPSTTTSSSPASTTSSQPYGLQYGQQPAQKGSEQQQQPAGAPGSEQDDCDAELEDAPEPSTVVTRNGRTRLSYSDEM